MCLGNFWSPRSFSIFNLNCLKNVEINNIYGKMYLVISCLSTISKVSDILFVRTNEDYSWVFLLGFYYIILLWIRWFNIDLIKLKRELIEQKNSKFRWGITLAVWLHAW